MDHYWREVFKLKIPSGSTKHPHPDKRCKSCFGVSVNNRVVTVERNKFSEDTINGLKAMKHMVKFSDPQQQKPENVPINGKILPAARSAYSVYQRKIKEDKTEDEKERKEKKQRELKLLEKKQEVESMRAKNTLFAKETSLSEQESSIRE